MWHLEFATDRPQTGVESIPNQLEKSDVFEKSLFPISVLKTQIFDSISANFQAPTEIDHLKPRSQTEILKSWTCSCGVRFDAVRVDCQEFSSQLNSIFSYRFDQFLRASHFDQFHGPVWNLPRSDHMIYMQQMLICNRILSTSLKYFVKVGSRLGAKV